MNHTPGPWFWDDRGNLVGEAWEERGSGPWDLYRVPIVQTDDGHYGPYGADRLLIAAAPELLAALHVALEAVTGDVAAEQVIEAAICKATGGKR